jgi:hypothetical protein
MNSSLSAVLAWCCTALFSFGGVEIDVDAFGKNLGGWVKRGNKAAEYPLSGSVYRTYKPEISPTPDGGLFVSVRIDHVRGWLASDDHAILEITVDAKGNIVCAQSNIAIQGRSISSDMILGGTDAGNKLVGTDRAVQIGTELVANLSAKLLREKIVEAGRVSFPSALRHNYNMLFQAVMVAQPPVAVPAPVVDATPAPPPANAPPVDPPAPDNAEASAEALKIKPYGTPTTAELPAGK